MSVRRLQAVLNRQTALVLAFSLIVLNLMLLSGGARALHTYPTFVAVGTNGGFIPDGGTLSVPVPLGSQAGDLLLAQVGYNADSAATITPGPGWTLVSIEDDGGSDIKHGIYWRIATASEPASYAFTLTSGKADTAAGAIAAYRGVDAANPIHTFASQDNGTALALDAPSITTSLAGTTVLALYTVRDLNQIDPPAGMDERWDAGSLAGVGDIGETRIEAAEEQWGAAGATGIRTATATASNGSVAHMIALAPPPTAPVYEVNSTQDRADTNPGDGLCNTGSLNTASEPECTLRAALEEANASAGADSVTFNIPSSEPGYRAAPASWVISPDAALPIATDPVSVDARTQPGWSGDPIIELDLTNAAGSVAGLVLWTDDSLIAGFAVHSSPDDGIEVDGTLANGDAADRNIVRDNWVGLDTTGAAIGNTDIGILITDNADDNQVIDNVVGLSGTDGIVVRTDSTRNLVIGNFVGVTSDLATAIPNGGHGIHIYERAWDNTFGGTSPSDANTVANNPLNGIALDADAGTGNALLGNIIYNNTQLGIDLGNDGPTANDPGDGDGPGPNNYINFPEIQGAVDRSGTVTVYYRLDAPAGNYRVEFFSNPSGGDATGGEAEVYEGAHTITGHPGGTLQYFASFPANAGDVITATATLRDGAMFGSTSEFANNVVAVPADFRVNSTGDAGDNNIRDGVCDTGGPLVAGRPECTLRAAIEETDALNLADVITFDIPTADPGYLAGRWTISPGSPLPTVNDEVVIDATTQPGYVSSPVIRVDGAAAGVASGFNLGIGSADSVLRGFMVTRFSADAVFLNSGIGRMTIEDNWLGTDGTGAAANGAGDDGIDINAPNVVIRNNVINNSGDDGIDVRDTGATIQGNIIGLEPDGSSGTGNFDVGIALFADGATIGGDTAVERNVISNNWEAIEVNSSNNIIQGNFIGTDATGSLDRGNRIGDGIDIQAGTNNLIGGTNSGEGNVIAYNQLNGVDVTGGTDNAIVGNNIYSNGGLGIDLGATGVTGNDPGDADVGPNTLQNFPVIQSVVEDTGTVTVTYDLDAAVGTYRVEFFTNPGGADPSGNGEGEVYVTSTNTSPGPGLTHTIPGSAGDVITATATFISGSLRSTSEFSPAETVTDGTAPVITLLGANPQTIEVGAAYVELGATAVDDVDGDITASIVIDASAVNTATLGSYPVTYDVTDSSGNAATTITRTVNVVDTTAPVITLLGPNPQTIEVGAAYVELGATAADNLDGDLTGSIVIDASAVNTAALGSYPVTYDVTDSSGNAATTITRTVNVVDTTAPVITLLGPNAQVVEIGSPYAELGAIAIDGYDGDITASIVIDSSNVDTSAIGVYTVTYDVVDSSGNPATASRTVSVVDTNDPPVLAPIPDQAGNELALITFVATSTDPEGDAVRYSLLGEPGNASIDPTSGVFTWTPNEAQGPGSYTFDVAATDNGTPRRVAIQPVTITVFETNQAPIIGSIGSRTSGEGDLIFLQATATDLDLPENALTFSATNLPPGVGIGSSGIISGTVAPGAAAAGPYVVRVSVTDDGVPSLSSSVTFTWTIEPIANQPPVAGDDLYSMPFNGPLSVGVPGVLGNDIDPDGDALGVSLSGPPPIGSLTLNADGSFIYVPLPDQDEPAVFTYRLDDGRGGFDTATVTVLMATNRPPIAGANTYRLDTFGRSVLTVLGNDTDPDGDAITIVDVISTGAKGDIFIREDVIDYYPAEGWIGDDFFAYVIEDTAGNTAVGQVHVIVEEDAGGNGERVTGVIGVPRAVFVSPPSTQAVAASIGLDVTISLLREAFWQSLGALRLPLIFLILAVLAVLLLGGITEAPVFLAASRRKFWAVVMLGRERTLTVHTDPDGDSDIIYNYAPTSTGIMSLDRPNRGYMPIDSPRGSGWVDMDFLTPATDLEYFMRDNRPIRLVEELRNVLEAGGDFSKLVSHRGYAIAIGPEIVQIPQHLAIASKTAVAAGSVPAATADLQEQVLEAIHQALLDLADISPEMAHSPAALIPTELWNFPYLAIHAPGHENWVIHFEYEERKPFIVGISLDQ